MRNNFILSLGLLLFAVSIQGADALVITGDTEGSLVAVQDRISIRNGPKIETINADPALLTADDVSVPTTAAVKGYVDAAKAGVRNRLINPDGTVWQRSATPATAASYADTAYCADRWIAMSDAASLSASRVEGVGTPHAIRLTASVGQRLGLLQKIEGVECRDLRGQMVTFGGRIRSSVAGNIHLAILQWTGTGDAMPADPIVTWGGAQTLALGAGWAMAGAETAPVAANVNSEMSVSAILGGAYSNLAVLLWSDALDAGSTVDASALRLVRGHVLTSYEPAPVQVVEEQCWRYYQQEHEGFTFVGQAYNDYRWQTTVPLFRPMRVRATADWAGYSGMLHNGNIRVKSIESHSHRSLLQVEIISIDKMARNGCYQLVITGWWASAEL